MRMPLRDYVEQRQAGDAGCRASFDGSSNFDIIWDHFPRIPQLRHSPHALWAVFYLVPSPTSC